jgi:threonine/homoserine/homoserine lactone efflux protein
MLMGIGKVSAQQEEVKVTNPLWTGIVLTAANPYFLLWWATVGMALATRAYSFGILAFLLFAVVHWICDLVWLEFLSLASHHGTDLMGVMLRKVLLAVCGIMMVVFGAWFLYGAAVRLRG